MKKQSTEGVKKSSVVWENLEEVRVFLGREKSERRAGVDSQVGYRNGQRCWNHRILNVLDKLPKKRQAAAKALLCQILYAPTLKEAEKAKEAFQRWCRQEGVKAAAELLDRDWERMVTFYRYPKEHWIHLRTTNPIESPFAAVRLRIARANEITFCTS